MDAAYIVIIIVIIIIIAFLYLLEPIISRQKIKNNNEHGSARWATKNEINDTFHKEKIDN